MRLTKQEIEYLRDLAMQVRDIAQEDKWDEKRKLWQAKNALKKVRPLLMCAIPKTTWFEIIPQDSLKIKDPLFRDFEMQLRQRIYRYHNLRDDIILNNKLYVPIDYKVTDWYVGRHRPFAEDAFHAAAFEASIVDYSDFEKINKPEIVDVNWDNTNRNYEDAKEVFGDLLDISIGRPFYANQDGYVVGSGASVIDVFIELRGFDNVLLDLYDEPEWCKEVMGYMTDCYDDYYTELEKYNLLRLNNNEFMDGADSAINSNGLTCLADIPGEKYDPDHVTTQNLWGYCMAQEFTMVSPDMLEEFVLPYQSRLAKRFGINGYGCCENLGGKYDMVKKYMPNLREFSITYTCDQEIAVENVKDEYVYSWKPSTTELITVFSEDRIRKQMKYQFDLARDCHLVASLRDTQTLYGAPERMTKWCDISMELAKEYE